MKSAWVRSAAVGFLSALAFGGCGGTSDGGGGSNAGTSSGGAGASSGGTSANGGASAGAAGTDQCDKANCGPQLGLPNWTCADGSLGGPTGRCLQRPNGACSWEINNCPMPAAGGAANEGGQGGSAGVSGGGGASQECGGCSAGTICVYQLGGPGPSHFVCATQNPCGAAAACACIVGQGDCQPDLKGEPPRYCECDNGLE